MLAGLATAPLAKISTRARPISGITDALRANALSRSRSLTARLQLKVVGS